MWGKTPKRPAETNWDEVWGKLARLEAAVSRIETEWGDTKDQVRRSYQRLEKAAQRAEAAAPSVPCPDDCPEGEEGAPPTLLDKIHAVRGG